MFRAHDPAAERLVAIKVFRLDVSPEQAAALVRELEQLIARDIAHRAVAAPIAAGIDGDAAYLAMEYVMGDSLDVTAGVGGPMPMAAVVRIVDGMAAAIDACAARGVHHGLLHPRDVILGAEGPRVTGFGMAETLSRIGLRLPVRRRYAAPEGASDVYSLAAIAYELISGQRMTPAGWDELSAEDGPELRDAFAAALSPDPQQRFGTAGEFAAKLREGGGSGASAGSERTRTTDVGRGDAVGPVLLDPAEASSDPARSALTMAEPDPAFDPDVLDRFADAGAASDLHLDFVEPPEAETPFPRSWSAQPPRALQAEESEPVRGARGRTLILMLIALAVAGVAAYLVSGRNAAPPPAEKTTPAKPPVTATTVDLPSAPAPVPPKPALPAPAPSRPASGATSAPPIRAAAAGRLLIRTTPADAAVTINGEPRGKTPLAVRDLALGSYTIHVTRNGFAAADRRVRLTARRPSESLEISLKAVAPGKRGTAPFSANSEKGAVPLFPGAGRLSVESRPSGARVFVNDRLVGSTPLAMPGLPAGPATVRIEKDGYQTWATTVRVNAGEQARVAASLDRR